MKSSGHNIIFAVHPDPPDAGEGGGGQAHPGPGVHLWQEEQPQPLQGNVARLITWSQAIIRSLCCGKMFHTY